MIAEYDKNGRIFHVMNDPVPEGMEEIMHENGCVFIVSKDTHIDVIQHYVKDGEIVERPTSETDVTINDKTVTIDTDSPIIVEVEGERISLDGNSFEIDEPGPLVLYIEHAWPIVPEVINIDVS